MHSAISEPFSYVICEAMLNSLPVLATKTGVAVDAIYNKENGYLVNPKSSEEFVKGLQFLLNNDLEKI